MRGRDAHGLVAAGEGVLGRRQLALPTRGYATCGEVGFEGRSDYAAIGAVTNLAARLGDEAAGGQILIERRLHAEVADDVEIEPAGELILKGFSRPVAAFDVLAVREGDAPGDAAAPAVSRAGT